LIVLGIETSCDETATAVSFNRKIISTITSTQIIHSHFGGVVPELASREHEKLLNTLVDASLKEAEITLKDLSGIAVTRGPGLAGTLLTGICFAKGLSQGLGIPIIGVNHLEAHIFANFIAEPTLEFPFVCLLVSGGHSQIWDIKGYEDYVLLGESRDDAAGEAFDKGARILGLGYPGGPQIEKLAKNGNKDAVKFPRSFLKPDNYEFSFSGLKTSLLYFTDRNNKAGSEKISNKDIAASFQEAILDVLVYKTTQALKRTGATTAVIAGGVAANLELRAKMEAACPAGSRVIFPAMEHCTDNAAMVAYLGELKLQNGQMSTLDFSVEPNLSLKVYSK